MKKNNIVWIAILSILVQSCGPAAITDSQTSMLAETLTATLEPTLTATFNPTILPTLPPTPTLIVPEELGTCFAISEPSQDYDCLVTTFAGGTEFSFGDGGEALEAELAMPTDVLVTDDGYLYIADSLHSLIRRVDPEGRIETYAGTGPWYGTVIDGRPATETGLRRPSGLAIDPDGLLYFADTKGYVVSRVEESGIVRNIVGSKNPNPMPEPFGDGGLATRAWIDQPGAIAIDSDGNLYVADTGNHRVRVVGGNGIISTLPIEDLRNPQALAVDSYGRLFIGNNDLMKIYNLQTGAIGTLSNESLQGVTSLAISAAGEIFFANPGRNQVGKLTISNPSFPSDEVPSFSAGVSIVAGIGRAGYDGDDGPATRALLDYPHGVAIDQNGNVFIADTFNHVIRMVDANGTISTIVGSGLSLLSKGPISYDQTTFNTTNGLTFDPFGNLFVTDFDLNLIRKTDRFGYVYLIAGDGISRFAGDGGHPLDASLDAPRAPVFDATGNLFFIHESSDGEVVRKITPGIDGEVNGSPDEVITTVVGIPGGVHRHIPKGEPVFNVPGRQAEFEGIRGMDFDSMGNLFVAEWATSRILMVTPGADGIISGDPDEMVMVVAGTGEARTTGSGSLAINASVSQPNWLAVDANDNVYFQENSGGVSIMRRIVRSTGIIESVPQAFPAGGFDFDGANNLYYSDSSRIYRIDALTGRKTLVAGIGTGGGTDSPGGYSGDGGDAREAAFQSMYYFAIDSEGNLYIDDSGNYRIRKITFVLLEE